MNRNLEGTGRYVSCTYEGKGYGTRKIFRYKLERVK